MSKYLFQDKSRFKFLEKVCSINQDGEKYVSISVLSLDNKKFNFISHDESVIQTIQSLNIENLSDIITSLGLEKYLVFGKSFYYIQIIIGMLLFFH